MQGKTICHLNRMSGADQILKTLQNMDVQRLTKILSEAKNWIDQSYEQARDQLLDSPQLAYALYHIPEILDQKYQDIESGVDSFGNQRFQNSQSTLYPNQYRNSQMQGVFLDFQSNNDNNSAEQQDQEQVHQKSQPVPPPQAPQQPMTIPVQSSYDSIPPPPPPQQQQPQNVYYPPQSNMYDQMYQPLPPQYQYPPNYGESSPPMQYQNQPQISYSYGPVNPQEYAPTYEGASQSEEMEEFRNIALGLTEEEVKQLPDEEIKQKVIKIRNEEFARQQQMQHNPPQQP